MGKQQRFEIWKIVANIVSVFLATLGLGISIYLAVRNIRAEQELAAQNIRAGQELAVQNIRADKELAFERAKLEFQMKVAELALLANSANAKQAKEKVEALADLFRPTPLLPKEFAEKFDPAKYKLNTGDSVRAREQVIALLAQHPRQRKQILSDWYVLFTWQRWWVEPLLEVSQNERSRLDELGKRVIENETKIE